MIHKCSASVPVTADEEMLLQELEEVLAARKEPVLLLTITARSKRS